MNEVRLRRVHKHELAAEVQASLIVRGRQERMSLISSRLVRKAIARGSIRKQSGQQV